MRTQKHVKSLKERQAEVRARHPHWRAKNSEPAPAPTKAFSDKDISLGLDDVRTPVNIKTVDRCEHMHVIGATGCGKSTFLLNCILQDITRGRGVCVLDPHGGHPDSLFNKVLAFLRDHGWFDTGKVHIIAPNSREHVVGLNPLAPIGDKDPAVIADALLEAFSRVWGNEDTHGTPTIRRILLSTFTALAEAHLPLAEATSLLDYDDRSGLREKLIASTKNEIARRTLQDIDRLSEKPNAIEQFNKTVLGPENRLVDFLVSDAIRLMFSTTRQNDDRTLDLLKILNRGDILLVDLQHGSAVSEAGCDLLGKIILRYLFLLMGSRKKFPLPNGELYHPFFVYIDEAHRYLSGDVPWLLTDARKFRVGLTLAHQFLGQLHEAGELVYNAVRNCTEAKVVFRVKSPEEAQELAHDVLPLSLETPLQASIRSTQVGSKIGKLKNETYGAQETAGDMRARHQASSIGETDTETHQLSRGYVRGIGRMKGSGSATISGSASSSGTVAGDSSMSSISYGYDPNNPGVIMPMPLSMNIGSADGASHSHIASESSQRSKSLNAFEGYNELESMSDAESSGSAYSLSHARMDGETFAASVARGTNHSQGVSEASLPIYKELPTSFHSKEHELYFKGELIRKLPIGRAVVRFRDINGFLNVPPPRKGKNLLNPAELETLLAALIAKTPAAQTRQQVVERRQARTQVRIQQSRKPSPSEELLAKPEPLPIIDNPTQLATEFWERFKKKEEEKRKPPKRSKPRLKVVDNNNPKPPDKKT